MNHFLELIIFLKIYSKLEHIYFYSTVFLLSKKWETISNADELLSFFRFLLIVSKMNYWFSKFSDPLKYWASDKAFSKLRLVMHKLRIVMSLKRTIIFWENTCYISSGPTALTPSCIWWCASLWVITFSFFEWESIRTKLIWHSSFSFFGLLFGIEYLDFVLLMKFSEKYRFSSSSISRVERELSL